MLTSGQPTSNDQYRSKVLPRPPLLMTRLIIARCERRPMTSSSIFTDDAWQKPVQFRVV